MRNKLIVTLLALALAFAGVSLAYASEAEWEDVKDNLISAELEKDSYPLLRQIMNGAFDENESAEQMKALSDALPLLAALPAEDLASFAAAYNLPVEAITESYYEALVNTLRANISLNPNESDEAQKTLKLLLSEDGEGADMAAVTPEALAQALASYQLPTGLADYLQNHDAGNEGGSQQDENLQGENDEDNGDQNDAAIEDGKDEDNGDQNDADIEDDQGGDSGDKGGAAIENDDDKDSGDEDSGSHDNGGSQDDGGNQDNEDNDD